MVATLIKRIGRKAAELLTDAETEITRRPPTSSPPVRAAYRFEARNIYADPFRRSSHQPQQGT